MISVHLILIPVDCGGFRFSGGPVGDSVLLCFIFCLILYGARQCLDMIMSSLSVHCYLLTYLVTYL